MEYPERAECDFSNGRQLELFLPPVCCAYCGKPSYHPHWVVKHFGHHTSQYAFCGEQHANDYYLEKLRETGM